MASDTSFSGFTEEWQEGSGILSAVFGQQWHDGFVALGASQHEEPIVGSAALQRKSSYVGADPCCVNDRYHLCRERTDKDEEKD